MSEEKKVAPYRIAFRKEGKFVNVYYARLGTMDDAVLLASVSRVMLEKDPQMWEDYQQMMRRAFERINEELEIPSEGFLTLPAPEHERTGEA